MSLSIRGRNFPPGRRSGLSRIGAFKINLRIFLVRNGKLTAQSRVNRNKGRVQLMNVEIMNDEMNYGENKTKTLAT